MIARVAHEKGLPSGWLVVEVTYTGAGADLTYHYGAYTTAKVSITSAQMAGRRYDLSSARR